MTEEIWKTIPSQPEYEASTLGRIRNKKTGRVLQTKPQGFGYIRVHLRDKTHQLAHRLIASTFLGEPAPGLNVNHIDGNPANNRIENLEWATQAENLRHSYRIGNRKNHNTSKLTRVDRDMIRAWYATGEFSKKSIARAFGVTPRAIDYAIKKEHYTFKEEA